MYETGCIVTVNTNKDDGGTQSGILVDTKYGLVITHGTLLTSVLSETQISTLMKKGVILSGVDLLEIEIILQKQYKHEQSKNLLSVLRSSEVANNVEINQQKETFVSKYSASVVALFCLKKLKQIVSLLMPEDKWEFVEDFKKQEKADIDSRLYPLLSCFVVLKLHDWKGYISNLPLSTISQLSKGDNLVVEATPFGGLSPEIFMNSTSSGVVSNKAGGILLLTDARCVPGSEGGPVFCKKGNQRFLVAMVIASLCWRNNEWVGLSMACGITEILKIVKQICRMDSIQMKILNKSSKNTVMKLIPSVPMVMVGSNWGSGVLIGQLDQDRSILVTCSHVVRESEYNTVKVKFTDSSEPEKATVIYKTPLDQQFDISLLSLPCQTVNHVSMSSSPVQQGDLVYVIGHAVFGEETNLEPTVTSGVVSKVIYIDNIPIMLQTTCAVHAGASGGAVVNNNGELVGITVSNAKDTVSKASYPHVNMCVPVSVIAPVIQSYMSSRDVGVLEKLSLKNKLIQQLWTLGQIKTASKL